MIFQPSRLWYWSLSGGCKWWGQTVSKNMSNAKLWNGKIQFQDAKQYAKNRARGSQPHIRYFCTLSKYMKCGSFENFLYIVIHIQFKLVQTNLLFPQPWKTKKYKYIRDFKDILKCRRHNIILLNTYNLWLMCSYCYTKLSNNDVKIPLQIYNFHITKVKHVHCIAKFTFIYQPWY
jgi:hypothetical protein